MGAERKTQNHLAGDRPIIGSRWLEFPLSGRADSGVHERLERVFPDRCVGAYHLAGRIYRDAYFDCLGRGQEASGLKGEYRHDRGCGDRRLIRGKAPDRRRSRRGRLTGRTGGIEEQRALNANL